MDKLNCSAYEISDTVEKLISEGAVLNLCVSGVSMSPFLISRRDIVYIRSFSDADLKKFSILLFRRSDGSLVLHRVVKVLPDGRLVMNGDAQNWYETIYKKQVIAVVSEIEHNGKRSKSDSSYHNAVNMMWHLLLPIRPLIMRVWFKIRKMIN